jgi:hypothetical protein
MEDARFSDASQSVHSSQRLRPLICRSRLRLHLHPLLSTLFSIEIALLADLIFLNNPDTPGMLRQVSSVLAEGEVNIANFALGRVRQVKYTRIDIHTYTYTLCTYPLYTYKDVACHMHM